VKITRRQIRQIIKEATIPDGDFEQKMAESTLAVKYIAEYLYSLGHEIQKAIDRSDIKTPANDGRSGSVENRATYEFFMGPKIQGIYRTANNIEADIPKSEYDAAKAEARSDAKNSSETIQQKIDNLDMYLYSQSPIGMSYVEAMRTYMFGNEDRGTADSIMQWFEDNGEWLERL